MLRVLRTLVAVASLVLAVPCLAPAQGKCEQPILLTSAGQSADVTIAAMLFKKVGLAVTSSPMAKVADLGGSKTLVVVAGFSTKGLGSAGVNRDQEMERVKALLAAARQRGVQVVLLHIGGKARRGPQSDEFNRVAAGAAGHLIVVRAGDEDQFFTKLAGDRKIGIDLVDKIADAAQPLGRLFQ
jgi:hypothetical protein